MVAFYSPIRNIPESQPAPESQENYSVSLNTASTTSTDLIPTGPTPTSSVSEKSSFEDMSGFSDLSQENDLLKEMGATSTTSSVDDIFNELK